MIKTEKYVKKPFYAEAVQVSAENINEVASWCGGTVVQHKNAGGNTTTYIKVPVLNPMSERQERAFPGDWILWARNNYKVYTQKSFSRHFEPVNGTDEEPVQLTTE